MLAALRSLLVRGRHPGGGEVASPSAHQQAKQADLRTMSGMVCDRAAEGLPVLRQRQAGLR